MNAHDKEVGKHRARLFRNGRSQAVRIPRDFEFKGEEVLIEKVEEGKLTLTLVATLYLLDTNAVSDLAANPSGEIARSIKKVGVANVATSVIVTAEIAFGLEQKGSERLRRQMTEVLSSLDILPLDRPADDHYGVLRAAFKKQGRPIGPNDLFIAAHALALDAVLVSANIKEFSRVPGLKLENWLTAE